MLLFQTAAETINIIMNHVAVAYLAVSGAPPLEHLSVEPLPANERQTAKLPDCYCTVVFTHVWDPALLWQALAQVSASFWRSHSSLPVESSRLCLVLSNLLFRIV